MTASGGHQHSTLAAIEFTCFGSTDCLCNSSVSCGRDKRLTNLGSKMPPAQCLILAAPERLTAATRQINRNCVKGIGHAKMRAQSQCPRTDAADADHPIFMVLGYNSCRSARPTFRAVLGGRAPGARHFQPVFFSKLSRLRTIESARQACRSCSSEQTPNVSNSRSYPHSLQRQTVSYDFSEWPCVLSSVSSADVRAFNVER